jgi:hypothetical protein
MKPTRRDFGSALAAAAAGSEGSTTVGAGPADSGPAAPHAAAARAMRMGTTASAFITADRRSRLHRPAHRRVTVPQQAAAA